MMAGRLSASLGIIVLLCVPLFAQSQEPDFFQSIGKIYVVVTVLVIIFLGLAAYLFRLDRKIQRLEKQSNNE